MCIVVKLIKKRHCTIDYNIEIILKKPVEWKIICDL